MVVDAVIAFLLLLNAFQKSGVRFSNSKTTTTQYLEAPVRPDRGLS
jgi:hypothetical protein